MGLVIERRPEVFQRLEKHTAKKTDREDVFPSARISLSEGEGAWFFRYFPESISAARRIQMIS